MSDLAGQIITFAGVLALIGAILWWTWSSSRRRLLRLAELLDERGGEVTGFPILWLEGHYQGQRVALGIHMPSGRSQPRALLVNLIAEAPLRFGIHKEDMADFVLARLGLTQDIEVGDPDLDHDFQFSSPEPARFTSWFADAEVRSTVVTLMRKRSVDVLVQNGELSAQLIRFSGKQASPDNIRGVLEGLCALRRSYQRE